MTAPLTDEVRLALGVSELTLFELTGAYAAVASGGRRVSPRGLVEVRDRLDRVVWCDPGTPASESALSVADARAMRGMLESVIRHGTGKAAATGFFAAGKTGTTNDFKDAWFVGFTDRFVAGVWLGNERGHAMDGVTGGGLPARIWRDVIREATKLPRYRRLPCEQPKGTATAEAD